MAIAEIKWKIYHKNIYKKFRMKMDCLLGKILLGIFCSFTKKQIKKYFMELSNYDLSDLLQLIYYTQIAGTSPRRYRGVLQRRRFPEKASSDSSRNSVFGWLPKCRTLKSRKCLGEAPAASYIDGDYPQNQGKKICKCLAP